MANPYPIRVADVRPEGHSSLQVLPRLAHDELDRLQAFYKFQLDFTHGYNRAAAGQLFWGIAALELKAGPAILQPQVRDIDGNLILTPPGILLFLHWPGAESFPAPVDPPYHSNGVGAFTEGKGNVGWGFGGESHIGGDGGPFTVWASSDPPDWTTRRVGSDAIRKLGWWDDHIIPNPIFQVMVKEGSQPPPGSDYLVNMAADGTILGHIPFQPGPPVANTSALGLMRGGVVLGHVAWGDGGPDNA